MSALSYLEGEGAFPVLRASQIPREAMERRWLIEHLWGHSAVGIIGGNPKCCKSWLALEMAVSVATGTRCLGCYEVVERGPALIYLAEDSLPMVRERLSSLAEHHQVPLEALDVHIITEPAIRLDLARDQVRLQKTVRSLRPKILVLDPLVRLHRLDENSASEVSGLLSYLREIQRELDVALVLVHHTRKNTSPGAQAGQGLRGSGDFHAWSDSSLYLRRTRGDLVLTIEHRSASAPEPVSLKLVARDDGPVHLEISNNASCETTEKVTDLATRLLEELEREVALTRSALRERLSVKNERLGPALTQLERQGSIERTPEGWRKVEKGGVKPVVPCSPP